MNRIYLDNSSSSFPKAPGVGKTMEAYLTGNGCNLSRGGYETAYSLAQQVLAVREKLCALFGFDAPERVIFTPGATHSLNYLMQGLLRPGDHVIVSSMEHNAVVRPLIWIRDRSGVESEVIPCNKFGQMDPDKLEKAIRPNTRAVVLTHASNVCGTIMPLAETGDICARHGVFFIADTAQTAGVIPLDFYRMKLSALAFAGHKGLLGPQGIGGFLIDGELAHALNPLIMGGTGSVSSSEAMPDFLPDKFEPGTLNLPGILGLGAALDFVRQTGIDRILDHEQRLAGQFLSAVSEMDGIRIAGLPGTQGRCAVVSLDFTRQDNAEIAYLLDSQYGISTRCGLHCAPWAHKTLGTFPRGTVRFSFGYFNTEQEVSKAIEAVAALSLA